MDVKLIQSCDAGKLEELLSLVEKTSEKEIDELIRGVTSKKKNSIVGLTRALLTGCSHSSVVDSDKLMSVYRACINHVQSGAWSTKIESEIVGLLMLKTDELRASCLAELVTSYIDAIKSGQDLNTKFLELLPKILSSLSCQDSVPYGGGDMTGKEYKSQMLNKLCSSRWNARSAIQLAAMLRDVDMTSDETKFAVAKIIRIFDDMDLVELPPLIYQLLLLSTKGHKKQVLSGISSFFTKQDKLNEHSRSSSADEMELSEGNHSDALQHTEGTVILHITFAIKQDQDLGKEFLKYIKACHQSSPESALAPFNIALCLSIAKMHRFQEQIFDFLKSAILKSYKDLEKQTDSTFISLMFPKLSNTGGLVMDTVQNSVHGWDDVTQGLVELGFVLMDAFGPRAVFGKIELVLPGSLTPSQHACNLGSKLLLQTFKVHNLVRSEILEQLLNRIVTKTTAPVFHYIELLESIVKFSPHSVLDGLNKVRELLDYLALLPPASALAILKSLQPLVNISTSLRDSLNMILRKAMFSRQLDSRKIAVGGFLQLLKHSKTLTAFSSSQTSSQSFSSSQSTASQVLVDIHQNTTLGSKQLVSLEIVGSLRRCLTQQADVRLSLYQGLCDTLQKNPVLGEPILQMLKAQMKVYYKSVEDVVPPVDLEKCITAQGDQIILVEPLAHLVYAMQQCVLHVEDNDTDVYNDINDMLDSLSRRMIKSELEDFELDKSADFSLNTGVGVKNTIFAILVLGLLESLCQYNFYVEGHSTERFQQIVDLFANYQRLIRLTKEKEKKSSGKSPTSLLSMKFVIGALTGMCNDEMPDRQESLAILRNSPDFTHHLLSVGVQKLQQISDKGTPDEAEDVTHKKLLEYVTTLARILLKEYTNVTDNADSHLNALSKPALLLCVEGLYYAINIVKTRFTDSLQTFLIKLDPVTTPDKTNVLSDVDTIHRFIKKLQRMVMSVLTSEDRPSKEASMLLETIAKLGKALPSVSPQHDQLLTWTSNLCKEQTPDDNGLIKVLVSLLIQLTSRHKCCLSLLRDIGRDLHSLLGDIDQEIELEVSGHYRVVTAKSCTTVFPLVLLSLDKQLDNTEWAVNRIKAEASALESQNQDTDLTQLETSRETAEKQICVRLGLVINVIHELIQSAVPPGHITDHLLKCITKLYNTITLLVKYYISLYHQKVGHMPGKFERLVKCSGTLLTQYVYSVIIYLQQRQPEPMQQTGAVKKLEKKSANGQGVKGKNKVLKESRLIPNVIFSIEQYERFLIQLSNKSKINLMENIKVSTSRDFRINTASLQMALSNQSDSDDSEGSGDENDEENEKDQHPPPSKKQKLKMAKK
ncbi:unnamed protein product [Owenia fusiformis]|uniref:Fanconi anemia group I protein n=1 Tax=Owenia fusiformis TaxID=6347 RepID=A0A8S4NN71_OWEFU|nr:unnamed protein product [Owenia fusiformis]